MKRKNILKTFYKQPAENNTNDGSIFFDEVWKIRLKAKLSLMIVWGSAICICGLFIFFLSLQTSVSGYVENSALLSRIQKGLRPVNDSMENDLISYRNSAFVFVHLNKKIFLTRFPSGKQDELPVMKVGMEADTKPKKVNWGEADGVIRKIKTTPRPKSTVDFTIKPVPQ